MLNEVKVILSWFKFLVQVLLMAIAKLLLFLTSPKLVCLMHWTGLDVEYEPKVLEEVRDFGTG